MKEKYHSTNKANYIRPMLKYNDRSTGLDNTAETLSCLALQGWYDIDLAKVFNVLTAAGKWRNTHRPHLLRLQHCQHEPFFRTVSLLVHHFSESHIRGVCRSIKLSSLREASEDVGITLFGQLSCAHIDENWRHEDGGLVVGYDQYVLTERIFINL